MGDKDIIGLTIEQADQAVAEYDFIVREVIRDGEPVPMTAEFRIDRVNVETKNGIIVKVVSVG